MTKDDAAQFEAGLLALAAVTGKNLDQAIKRAYWVALQNIPGDTVLAALRIAMEACDYFPSAADIRRLCDEAENTKLLALAEAVPAQVPMLPDPDAQYRGVQEWEPPAQTYHCWHCKDTGFVHFICSPEHRNCSFRLCIEERRGDNPRSKQSHSWCRKCDCMLPGQPKELDHQRNPVIMARIVRERERLGITEGKYGRDSKALRRRRRE